MLSFVTTEQVLCVNLDIPPNKEDLKEFKLCAYNYKGIDLIQYFEGSQHLEITILLTEVTNYWKLKKRLGKLIYKYLISGVDNEDNLINTTLNETN